MVKLVPTSVVQNSYHQLHVEAFSCVGGFPSAGHIEQSCAAKFSLGRRDGPRRGSIIRVFKNENDKVPL